MECRWNASASSMLADIYVELRKKWKIFPTSKVKTSHLHSTMLISEAFAKLLPQDNDLNDRHAKYVTVMTDHVQLALDYTILKNKYFLNKNRSILSANAILEIKSLILNKVAALCNFPPINYPM